MLNVQIEEQIEKSFTRDYGGYTFIPKLDAVSLSLSYDVHVIGSVGVYATMSSDKLLESDQEFKDFLDSIDSYLDGASEQLEPKQSLVKPCVLCEA